jgi:stage II sporulation protein D
MLRIGSTGRTALLTTVIAVAVVLGGCHPSPKVPQVPGLSLPERLQVRTGGRVVSVPLEEYVLGSTLAEVSPVDQSSDTTARIFDVQSILARTYGVAGVGRHHADGFDLCDTTHCQVYDPARIKTSRFASTARAAVERTAGEVITYDRHPVEAVYHADCGGYTASAETVWGGRAVPYLLAEPDKLPSDPHRKWRVSVTSDRLRAALNADEASAVGRKLDDVRVVSRDVSGRVVTASITGEHPHTLRGEQLRSIINATLGDKGILSTKLSISRSSGSFVFEGTGYGHGVGLCQVGAAARAKRGDSIEDIISHYFPGAIVARAR